MDNARKWEEIIFGYRGDCNYLQTAPFCPTNFAKKAPPMYATISPDDSVDPSPLTERPHPLPYHDPLMTLSMSSPLTELPLVLDGELVGLEADLRAELFDGLVGLHGHLVFHGSVLQADGAVGPGRRLALTRFRVSGLVPS